jgi:hypothetical protein
MVYDLTGSSRQGRTHAYEIEGAIVHLQTHPEACDRMRRAAKSTPRLYTWETAVRNLIGKLEHQARLQG